MLVGNVDLLISFFMTVGEMRPNEGKCRVTNLQVTVTTVKALAYTWLREDTVPFHSIRQPVTREKFWFRRPPKVARHAQIFGEFSAVWRRGDEKISISVT
jgi:hypothetical protein